MVLARVDADQRAAVLAQIFWQAMRTVGTARPAPHSTMTSFGLPPSESSHIFSRFI